MIALINIQLALNSYILMLNKFNKRSIETQNLKKRLLIFGVISFIYYIPNIAFNKIYKIKIFENEAIESENIYFIFFNQLAQDRKSLRIILTLMELLVSIISLLTMIILNLLIFMNYKKSCQNALIKSRKIYVRKNKKTFVLNGSTINLNEKKIKRMRVTLMILWVSLIFIIDQILLFTSNLIMKSKSFPNLVFIAFMFFRCIFSLSNSVFYFIYDEKYRKIIKNCLIIIMAMVFTILILILFLNFLASIIAILFNHF